MSKFNWNYSYPRRHALVGTCTNTELEGLVTAKGQFTIDIGKMKTSEHTRMINSIRRGYTLSKTGPARRILTMLCNDPAWFGLDPFPLIGYVGKQNAEVIVPVQWAENGVEINAHEQFAKAKDMVDSLKATAFMMDVDLTDKYATFAYTKHDCGYYRLVISATNKGPAHRTSQLESVTNKLTPMLSKWGEIMYPKRKQLLEFIRSKPKLIISFDTGGYNV